MKILLISNGRTGSYSICEWLSKELTVKFITEIEDSLNYKVEDNFILKRTLSNNDFDLKDIIFFNKIIILYRKNTLKQSESNLYAILRKKWHHYSNSIIDGYYEIDEDSFEDILQKYTEDKSLKLSAYEKRGFSIAITLGCSPKFKSKSLDL